jgi:hypothetical protein
MSMSTNGANRPVDTHSPRATEIAGDSDGKSAEERLDGLLELIRKWDWRASSSNGSRAPAASTAPATPLAAPEPVTEQHRKTPEVLRANGSGPVPGSAEFPRPDSQGMGHFVSEWTPHYPKADQAPADLLPDRPEVANQSAAVPSRVQELRDPSPDGASASRPQHAVPPSPAEFQTPAVPRTSRAAALSRIRVFALYLASAIAVVLVIAAIRTFA